MKETVSSVEWMSLDENACILLLITFTGLSSSTWFLFSSVLVDGRPMDLASTPSSSHLIPLFPLFSSPYFPPHPPPQSRPSPCLIFNMYACAMHTSTEKAPKREFDFYSLCTSSEERELLWVFRITLNAMFCVSPQGKKLKAEAVDSIVFLLHWMTYDFSPHRFHIQNIQNIQQEDVLSTRILFGPFVIKRQQENEESKRKEQKKTAILLHHLSWCCILTVDTSLWWGIL